jgi:predicted fused transcriptional regulator/phosphomethylpyrimidine kinase
LKSRIEKLEEITRAGKSPLVIVMTDPNGSEPTVMVFDATPEEDIRAKELAKWRTEKKG